MKLFLNRINFSKLNAELSVDYDNLPEVDKQKILNIDAKTSFDFDTDDGYRCYLLTSKMEIEIYKKILDDNLISYLCEDISALVVSNKINLDLDVEDFLDHTNHINYDSFKFDIDTWIYDQLDLDGILDRISESGIDSLRKIDIEFLKNYK